MMTDCIARIAKRAICSCVAQAVWPVMAIGGLMCLSGSSGYGVSYCKSLLYTYIYIWLIHNWHRDRYSL